MREEPWGMALLEAALLTLREDVLPSLPADKRHGALMVAKALSIALRQVGDDHAPELAERHRLGRLLAMPDDAAPLAALYRRLNSEIRTGQADPGAGLHGPVLSHLREMTRQRLSESNPKVLQGS